jgi:hypothetical protein
MVRPGLFHLDRRCLLYIRCPPLSFESQTFHRAPQRGENMAMASLGRERGERSQAWQCVMRAAGAAAAQLCS